MEIFEMLVTLKLSASGLDSLLRLSAAISPAVAPIADQLTHISVKPLAHRVS